MICSYESAVQKVLNSELIKNKRGNPSMRDRPRYINLVTAFDIETTRLPDIEQSFMYIWQWQLGEDCTIIGRTWEDFNKFTKLLTTYIKQAFGDKAKLVVWVHNLSFEFSFLKGIYPFKTREVFCMERRKVVKCSMFDCLEFRCSYIHSNMSLDLFTKKMNCTVRKLTGTFDYDKIRYPWTELTKEELAYCINDVRSLVEAITKEMELDGDDLGTIPMTSTGYVRRDAKAAIQSDNGWRYFIRDQLPDFEFYLALREAFRGGNTHGNRFMVGKILKNVHSVDRSSSYPDVLVNCKFPVSQFEYRGAITEERLLKNIDIHKKAAVIRVSFTNLELKDQWCGCPYLTKDKCRDIANGVFDNGRILSADFCSTTLTDIDYKIVRNQYSGDMIIHHSWFARYGYLPQCFRDLIIDYYKKKTDLKGVEEQKVFYDKIKNKINALYGMTAQNPVKDNIIFADAEHTLKFYDEHPDFVRPKNDGGNFIPDLSKTPEELLIKYNSKTFLVYQWGVWVTAHARRELQEMIDLSGDNFVYADTDSVKYIGELDLTEYNTRIKRRSEENNAVAFDRQGIAHYMGVFEKEKDADAEEFITLGAKKYAYVCNGKLTVTCAGVNKKLGGVELQKAGGLKAFKPGMVFKDAGGTEAVYNDNVDFWIERDGHKLHITDNVVIRPSEYTLGVTNEYKILLHRAELLLQLDREHKMSEYLENLLTTM